MKKAEVVALHTTLREVAKYLLEENEDIDLELYNWLNECHYSLWTVEKNEEAVIEQAYGINSSHGERRSLLDYSIEGNKVHLVCENTFGIILWT